MPPEPKYAVVFSNDMMHPLIIRAPNFIEFLRQLEDVVLKYGQFELIYRVY